MTETADKPIFVLDHLSWTVADLAPAVAFYCDVIGATEQFRMGPLDAAEMPVDAQGRDWMETHIGVAGAKLTLVMLRLSCGTHFQLVQYDKPDDRRSDPVRCCDRGGHHLGLRVTDVDAAIAYLADHGCTIRETIAIDAGPLAGKKNVYALDPFGNPLEIVD